MTKRIAFWLVLSFLVGTSAFAQVPDERALVRRLHDTGLYDLKTPAGHDAFVDVVVSTLHAKDKRWGHLKKNPGQAQIHGHGEDSVLFLVDEAGQSQAVDFIGGAGGPNPQPGWIVDVPRYSKKDWANPEDHGFTKPTVPPPPPPPQYPPYPFPEDAVDGAGIALFVDFGEAKQQPNQQMFRFAFRVAYDWLTKNVESLDASIAKHRREWRALLGLSPVP